MMELEERSHILARESNVLFSPVALPYLPNYPLSAALSFLTQIILSSTGSAFLGVEITLCLCC
jgi:hypothetical protein